MIFAFLEQLLIFIKKGLKSIWIYSLDELPLKALKLDVIFFERKTTPFEVAICEKQGEY